MQTIQFKTEASSTPCFKVSVAKTNEQKRRGLEVFESLETDQGLLFPMNGSYATFHMGSVRFPIDIIFLLLEDKDNLKVAKIVHDVQPGDLSRWSNWADYVLEVTGGTCKANNIKVGTVCQFRSDS